MIQQRLSVVVGIDPGKAGAVAVLHRLTGEPLAWSLLPEDAMELFELLTGIRATYETATFGIEKPIILFGKSSYKTVASSFRRFGQLEALVRVLRLQATFLHPRNWTGQMHEGADGSTPKEKSLFVAKGLWPEQTFTFKGSKARKPHDGIVDAMLIAEYTRRKMK